MFINNFVDISFYCSHSRSIWITVTVNAQYITMKSVITIKFDCLSALLSQIHKDMYTNHGDVREELSN